LTLFEDRLTEEKAEVLQNVSSFILGRYINDKISKGTSAETVEAVTSVHFDDIVDCSLKIASLKSASSQDSFPVLAGAFKRVMNIIRDHRAAAEIDEALLQAEAEKILFSTYKEVYITAEPLIEKRQYEEAMQVILKMKEPVDRFFDDVMVLVEDEKLKNNRLALLNSIAALFLRIGDFSKMYAVAK
jgi:glycyl-tRNA synthetase beta chain